MTGLNLSEWALTHRSLTIFLMIVAVGAGVMSYFRLGRSEDPSFVIKTMIVQAAWPGATAEETLKQVTERLERTLQETPRLDFLRSFTRAGVTTIFVNLKGNTPAKEVPDIWYHVRKSIGDMRATLPLGVVGPNSAIRSGSFMDSQRKVLRIANFETLSRTSVPSFCMCPTYRRSKSWEPRTKRFSSNFRCSNSPAWASIDRL
jgi:hypothetical protein